MIIYVRWLLTLLLLFGVYTETGIYTVLFAALVVARAETFDCITLPRITRLL